MYFQISKAVADVPPISKEMKTIQEISDILSIIISKGADQD